jgi:thiol reductant ABC exporter CydC subunit
MTRSTSRLAGRLLALLLALLRPFWKEVGASVLLGALTIASSVGLMMTSAWLISKCALQPSIAELGVSIVAVRFFGLSRAVFRYLERLVSHDTTFRILARLRVDFYRAVEPLAPARLSRFQTGDLLARVVADIESLQEVYLRAIAPPVVAVVTAAGVIVLFAAFNWLTALIVLCFMAVSGTALPFGVARASQAAGRDLVGTRGKMNAALVDGIQGLPEILAYGYAKEQSRQLETLSGSVTAQQRRLNQVESLQAGAMALLVNGAALAVLASALPRVEGIYLASLALGVFAAFEAFMPLTQAATQWNVSLSAARRLFGITDTAPVVRDPAIPAAPPTTFDVQIADVSFQYVPQGLPVFDRLNLVVRQGERIAILGSSGSGKSTLVNLLVRFWDYPRGNIRIGGVELKTLSQADARQLMAVMAQQTYLFNTTILENIRIAQPEASDEQVKAAARKARIHDFIAALPQGYETLVGENGVGLSGGERRRVALARALLKSAPILILDEPTAYLDTSTERAILETIFESVEGRTLILLTHRRMLLERVDHIYRIEAGHLVQLR